MQFKPILGWVLLAVISLSGLGFAGWYFFGRPGPTVDPEVKRDPLAPGLASPDPRLSYAGPFKNVHPEVAYVSDAECARCHKPQARTFRDHPMARTFTPLKQAAFAPFDAKSIPPFEAFGQQFQVERREGRTWHVRSALDSDGKPLFRRELEAHYLIGSGTRAHSFLSLEGGTFYQTPITWYAQKKIWDLSPGFKPNSLAGRRVGADCLFCHTNGANEDPKEETRYLEPIFANGDGGIGCQRCHGPGALHVKNPAQWVKSAEGKFDPTIVNPAHLTPALREAVCWQCHLEGTARVLRRGRQRFEFRPGMPLEDFVAVYDDAAHASYDHVVNHVEQMMQSRCYQRSAGPKQMGCVSCHDPHEAAIPSKRAEYYQTKCLACHQDQGCSLPQPKRIAQQKDDSCIACHMPAFDASDVSHVSSTDHRVPRKRVLRKVQSPSDEKHPIEKLESAFEHLVGKRGPELDRDRALTSAILERGGQRMLRPLNQEFEAAIARDPGDLILKSQYALNLINRGEFDKARRLAEDALARQADYEFALFAFALACSESNRIEEAIPAWRRLVKLGPRQHGFRLGLVEALIKGKHWQEAADEARAWIAVDPGIPEARARLAFTLYQLNRIDESREQERIHDLLAKRALRP